MLPYLLLGTVLLVVLLLAARGFVRSSPGQLAQALRAFVAGFSALAGTGLLFAGRFGLAIIMIGATIMAVKAMRHAPLHEAGGSGRAHASEVRTDTLLMQLDHATGALEGEVLRGPFAGRSLESMGLSELLDLLADCQREDPRSVALLETYLDRRQPDWRADLGGRAGEDHGADSDRGERARAAGEMDEATAWSVLGLRPGASVEEIKTAHRRLMTKLHPDHGGSDYLAAQLNQAKDLLLGRRR